MKKSIRLGLAQINCTVGDLEGNADKIISFIEKGSSQGVDIIVFPEMALTGYPPEDLLLKQKFVDDNLEMLDSIAKKCLDITVIVGFADKKDISLPFAGERHNKIVFNAAAIIQKGAMRDVYHKVILPNYGVFDEKRYFLPGSGSPVYDFDGLLFGVNICEDIWHADGPAKIQAQKGAQLIININASPFYAGKILEREAILGQRIAENGIAIAYTNLVGGQDELVFDGGSMILNDSGEVKARAPQFEETLLIVDIETGRPKRKYVPRKKDNGDKGNRDISLEGGAKKSDERIEGDIASLLDPVEEVYRALVLGTRDYVQKSGFQKVIIGLSGGIDSAVTAAIAVDALGADAVMGIAMPTRYSSEGSIKDARKLSENLGIEFYILSIEEIFNAYTGKLAALFSGYEEDVTEENIQARIRGNVLMALSNKFGRMVLATGNKSEVSVGYSTLYGDMAGGFSVLKDVLKTLVYKLAHYRNESEGREIIPESSITKLPSAELRPGQTDQDSLPPYNVLDEILLKYIEKELSFSEIVSLGYDPLIVEKVVRMVDSNEYKRRQAAPGVKITPKAFGRDRRMPIVNGYRGLSE